MWWSNKKGFLGGVPIKRRKRHLGKFPGDVGPLQLLNNIFLTFQRQLYLKNLIGWSWFRSCTNLGDQWMKLPNIVSVFRLEDLPMKLDYPILHPKTMWLRKSSRILKSTWVLSLNSILLLHIKITIFFSFHSLET